VQTAADLSVPSFSSSSSWSFPAGHIHTCPRNPTNKERELLPESSSAAANIIISSQPSLYYMLVCTDAYVDREILIDYSRGRLFCLAAGKPCSRAKEEK
jgi:hypothetical protein